MNTPLNSHQLEAATHLQGPLLVLAGAGSGKTRIVTQRIHFLIREGVAPDLIVAVTFTNKAAEEMRERIHRLLENGGYSSYPLVCTFHSLGAKILRESISSLGYQPNFTIYDEEDVEKLLKAVLQQQGLPHEKAEVKRLRQHISSCKNQLVRCDEIEDPDFRSLFHEYQVRMKESNACDFDDLLYLTVLLFEDHPEIKHQYQNRWQYLLIDEYQDTNRVQHRLAYLIVEPHRNIFVVGDPDQSIYSWRGANIHNILEFEKEYTGSKTIRLEQNYRSRSNILEAANALIRNNQHRIDKNLWSDRGPGPKIQLYVGRDGIDEASFVAEQIEELHHKERFSYSEMTIFYRTNFQSRLFEDSLLSHRIPYRIIGGISFYQRKEIKDLLAFLRMVESDQDTLSFLRTVNLPKRGLGQKTLDVLFQSARSSILAFCLDPPAEIPLRAAQKSALQEYGHLILALRECKKTLPLHRLMIETVRKTGYLEVLKEDRDTFEDRKANLDELFTKAREWELSNPEGSLVDFLEELSLRSSLDEHIEEEDAVNLMTLHNGKGLEFSIAFLVGMEEDLFPHVNSRESYEQLEEERRLCYVGMTRAKERLYLTAAESRLIWGGYRMMRPSRFLREIPRSYIERVR